MSKAVNKSGESREAINRRRVEALNKHLEELERDAGGDLAKAERRAAGTMVLGSSLPVLMCGMIVVLVSIFMPHSGEVHGYDVLFYSDTAQTFVTTLPERVYVWLALVGGVLLTLGTAISRSSLVAWLNWTLTGIGWVYAVLAIGMRQSRPPTEPGDGPSFGLVMGFVGMLVIFVALSSRLLRRGAVQKAIAAKRRAEAGKDEESRAAQLVLRTGLAPRQDTELVDDRRDKVRARRHRAEHTDDAASGDETPDQQEDREDRN
ncbi:Rv2732c family membrane protein [Corynebacterium glyciniphilum]|uniref:Rv2732c family membrane protein n=1 Tax=Corynebacterium glyciniphilum TaxID=1404244 RepID=UPI003FD12D95